MAKFYDAASCRRKADQEWDMAGLARQDGDLEASEQHTANARKWDQRAAEGGWQES